MTGQFDGREILRLERMSAEELIATLPNSSPVVVLRALTEIRLNGDAKKLLQLLASPRIDASWRGYANDAGVDGRDHKYADKLRGL